MLCSSLRKTADRYYLLFSVFHQIASFCQLLLFSVLLSVLVMSLSILWRFYSLFLYQTSSFLLCPKAMNCLTTCLISVCGDALFLRSFFFSYTCCRVFLFIVFTRESSYCFQRILGRIAPPSFMISVQLNLDQMLNQVHAGLRCTKLKLDQLIPFG